MVSGSKSILLTSNITASAVTDGENKSLPSNSAGLILVCKVSSHIDGTYTAKAQHSIDGITYKDLVSAPIVSGDGFEMIEITGAILPYVRCELTAASVTAGAEVEVSIYYGRSK